MQIAGLLAGFCAGSWFIVKNFGVVPAMRGLYLFAFVSMTGMFFIRNQITHETRIGILKMQSAGKFSFVAIFGEYKEICIQLIKNSQALIAFALMVLNNIQITLRSSFQAILLTKGLELLSHHWHIPAIPSAVMLFIYLFVMPASADSK